MDIYDYLDKNFNNIEIESIYEDYYTIGSENLTEGKNLDYFKYVTNHIKNVKKGYRWLKKNLPEIFEGKNKFKISLAIALHDRSKFLLNKEFKSYRDYFYGDKNDEQNKDAVHANFQKAWNHHQKINKHHWQYWVLIKADGSYKVLDMPYENIIEMICDWWSFSWKTGNLYDIFSWYEKNKKGMILSPNTISTIEGILKKMKNKLDELSKKNSNLSESVLDPIRKTRCPDIFSDVNEENPKLKPEIKELIMNAAIKFLEDIEIPDAKIIELFIVGSSLGFQYRDDSDIDVDLRINIEKDKLSGKFYLIPKGIVVPNTEHPINIYLLSADDPEYNFDKDAENAYDVLRDKWIKQSKLENKDQIPYAYVSGISEFLIDGMTLQLQRAERDIRELKKYIALDPNVVAITEKEKDEAISNKISDLLIDKDALSLAHHIMFKLDQEGFTDNPIRVSIDYKHDSRHFSMNNLIYKYIDSFKYYDKINDTIKQIDLEIENAQQEIKKNSAENTPEGQNKEEVQKEIKEEYSDDELKNILVENGYEPTEKNIRVFNKNYFIVDLQEKVIPEIITEDLRSKYEKKLNKIIFKASKKWSRVTAGFWGWFFSGIVGLILALEMTDKHNVALDEKEQELYDAIESDPKAEKVVNSIKAELEKEHPDKSVLKSLKKEFAAIVKQISLDIKKSANAYNTKPYLSLRED